jgi:hypothetical protein
MFGNRTPSPGLPDFSWCMIPKPEKMYQMNTNCTKWSWGIPNVRTIFHTALKFINIFQSKALQNLLRLGFLVWKQTIWQPCDVTGFSWTRINNFPREDLALNFRHFWRKNVDVHKKVNFQFCSFNSAFKTPWMFSEEWYKTRFFSPKKCFFFHPKRLAGQVQACMFYVFM